MLNLVKMLSWIDSIRPIVELGEYDEEISIYYTERIPNYKRFGGRMVS